MHRFVFRKGFGAALILVSTGFATDFYVAPNGSGDGSLGRPWDLATALAQPGAVHAGDTIWLRGGTYRGIYSSYLNGGVNQPIIVRQYPGERATIDGSISPSENTLTIAGSWTWYWGFEVTNSYPNRALPSSTVRGSAIVMNGTNSKLINMVVHDGGLGFSFWTPAQNSELYGNLIYYNGYDQPDRGHGHGIYVQNATGTKYIRDNIVFDQFSYGIHAYTESGSINNLYFDGNISFNNGSPSFSGYTNNILVGGLTVAQNPTVVNNYTYYTPSARAGYNNFGYVAGCSNGIINNNYFVSGYMALSLPNCVPTSLSGNTFYGATPGWIGSSYPNNTYLGSSRPGSPAVFVRPNLYETGRANIAIFNWPLQSSVAVDLSGIGLSSGSAFEIRDSENFFGPAVVSGTYTGAPVSIPMTGLTKVAPVGTVDVVPPHSAPEFGTFIVLPKGASSVPVSVSVAPATPSLAAGKSQQFTAGVTGSANTAVTWSLNPQAGTISGTGLYTAPAAVPAVQRVILTATSVADPRASGSATITLQPAPSATAQFVKVDAATQGNWRSGYGAEGYNVLGDVIAYPSYATVTPNGQSFWTWSGSTSDVRALQKSGASDHVAATWYSGDSLTVDVNLAGGQTHALAVYSVDWENAGRSQTVDVLDAQTGVVLDTRNLSGFSGGQYLVWNLSGHVILRFTRTGGNNAVVSGIFFGGAATPSLNTAQFVGLDTTTQGSWKGVYGQNGYNVLGDANASPSFVTVVPGSQSFWTWTASTTDIRALQKSSATDRVAATWYSGTTFTVDVNVTDGQTHRLAVYSVDWENAGRAQTVDVLDGQSGVVVDTRQLSLFSGGQYLVWNISGHVTLRFTRTGGNNAVVSGIFF